MKLLKKILCLLLVLSMLLSLGVAAFAEETETFDYVSLGASMTNGYGMRYYLDEEYYKDPGEPDYKDPGTLDTDGPGATGLDSVVEKSYPALICKTLGDRGYHVEFAQLAQSSMRPEELRVLLDDDYYGDGYTKWRFYNNDDLNDETWWNNKTEGNKLAKLRDDYQQSIAAADLITYDLGVNNFGVYISNQLQEDLFTKKVNGKPSPDIHDAGTYFGNIVGEEMGDLFYKFRDELHKALINMVDDVDKLDDATFEKIDHYLDVIAYANAGFIVNFDVTMGKIRELNPDCDIVVVSIQNPMEGLNVDVNGILIPFGDIFKYAIRLANAYIAGGSPYRDEYYFADVSNNGRVEFFLDEIVNYNGNPASLSQAMKDCLNVYDRQIHCESRVDDLYIEKITRKTVVEEAGEITERGIEAESAIIKYEKQNGNTVLTAEYKNALNDILSYKFINPSEPKEGEYTEEYGAVLNAVYDGLARMLQSAAKINTLPVAGLLGGQADLGDIGDDLMDGFVAAVSDIAQAKYAELKDEDEPTFDLEAATAALLDTDAEKTVASFGMRTSIGNTFFTHPNAAGHAEIARTIMMAWDQKLDGNDAIDEAIDNIEQEVFDNLVKYGPQYAVAIIEKLIDTMPEDYKEIKEFMKFMVPSGDTAVWLVKAILKSQNITSFSKLKNLENQLDSIAALYRGKDDNHTHKGTLMPLKLATCTKDGCHTHYVCKTCGKYFSDYMCKHELSYDQIVIPATGHHTLLHVWAKPATLLLPGNIEYWYCLQCGDYFKKDGSEITNKLDVVIPAKLLKR